MQAGANHDSQKSRGPDTLSNSGGRYSLKEACEILGICEATGRNWINNGRLKVEGRTGRKIHLSVTEVQRLKSAIQKGQSGHLRSRRNKSHKKGIILPVGYLSQKLHEKSVKGLVQQLEGHTPGYSQVRLILAEQSIRLLQGRGLLQPFWDKGSRVIAYQQGELKLGAFEPLIAALMPEGEVEPISDAFVRTFLLSEVPLCYDEDYLGLLYTVLQCVGRRKAEGIYYTPFKVVRATLDMLCHSQPEALNGSVLDPCCGTGQFLIQAYKDKCSSGVCTEEDKTRYLDLYGFDSDPISISLARINMVLLSKVLNLEALYAQFRVQDTLEDRGVTRFGCIIGNPPWGYRFSAEQLERLRNAYTLAEATRVESYGLFLEWSADHLTQGGSIAFVLPESLLDVKYHQRIRHLIREKYAIGGVCFLENAFTGVFMPAIALILQSGAEQGLIRISQKSRQYTVGTDRWGSDDALHLRSTDEVVERLKQMDEKGVCRLKDNAIFAMGIVTGDNRSFISTRRSKGTEPLLTGKEVMPFKPLKPKYFIRSRHGEFQQMAPLELYRAPEKLIYRFIADRLVFALDDSGALTLNSCNCILPQLPGYSSRVLLSLLNSEAMQFYYQSRYRAMKVLKEYLETLPIPVLTEEEKSALEALCDKRLHTRNQIQIKKLEKQMNHIIWNAYGISRQVT